MKIIKFIFILPRRLVILPIIAYQKTISPDHGWLSKIKTERTCRFEPTCSDYTKQAILKYGIIIGIPKGTWRIMRCNPWSKGGFDPVK